ncbi:MAG: WbqC family protein [Flavobacteriales bacterium]
MSAFYFGSVEHYRLLAQHKRVVIDIGEHYERQSYRTRTGIIGPNGRQDLLVHIDRRSGEKMPMSSVGLSYVENWPHQHVHAIRSAYGQTPWFIHYIDEIEATVLRKYDRLVDLDLATMRLGMKWLGLKTELVVSENYVDVESGEWRVASTIEGDIGRSPLDTRYSVLDLRNIFHPKRPLPRLIEPVPSYPQIFADRHGFIPRMSIVDLVCNRGPRSMEHLRAGT